MYSATVIAHFFVLKAIKDKNFINQMKLQKLVYFAHGLHLSECEKPLVKEPFEATEFGPVISLLRTAFALYGSREILDTGLIHSAVDISLEYITNDEDAVMTLISTWQILKDVDYNIIFAWSKQRESPWANTIMNHAIQNSDIEKYFKLKFNT